MGKRKTAISVDEWLTELTKAENLERDGFTTRDVVKILKVTTYTARCRMHKWFEDGLIEMIGKKEIRTMDGKRQLLPLYGLKHPVKTGGRRPRPRT